MNMHINAPAADQIYRDMSSRDDSELIALCKKAEELFTAEQEAEKRLFDAMDNDLPQESLTQASRMAVEVVRQSVKDIAKIQARTGLGMANKACLLASWDKAGLTFDDEAGWALVMSIAFDARIIGTNNYHGIRPPSSDVGQPTHI